MHGETRCMSSAGAFVDTQHVFNGLSERDVVSRTVLLTAYAQLAQPGNALKLYQQMQEEGVTPNNWTIVGASLACGALAEQEVDIVVNGIAPSQGLHITTGKGCLIRSGGGGMESNADSIYSQAQAEKALQLYDQMPEGLCKCWCFTAGQAAACLAATAAQL